MIVLVWSLVSSVVEAARRRRLAAFLRHFHADPSNRKSMLVCKRIRPTDSFPSPAPSSGRLTRFTSEPQLHTQQLIYRTEKAELAVEPATALHGNEWRFVDIVHPSEDEEKIYFVAQIVRVQPDDEPPGQAVFLDSCCIRIAWHKLQPVSLYSCDIDQFVDLVYAFSEGALFENNTSALVESLHTIFPESHRSLSPAHSTHSNSSSVLTLIQKQPLPLLEQLFRGDGDLSYRGVGMRYGSETALHNGGGHYGSLPRRTTFSPSRRRYRSYNSSTRSSRDIFAELGGSPQSFSKFFDPAAQLPPFLRNLDQDRNYSLYTGNTMEQPGSSGRSLASSGISASVTIEGIDLGQDEDLRSLTDLPYVDDSAVASPLAITDTITSSYAALVYRETTKRTANVEREEKGAGEASEQLGEEENWQKDQQRLINGLSTLGDCGPRSVDSQPRQLTNGIAAYKEVQSEDNPKKKTSPVNNKPPIPTFRQQKRSEQHSCPPPSSISRRRHSAMVQALADTTFNFAENGGRHRSVSPMVGEMMNGRRRSLRNSMFGADSGSIELPPVYTPSRRIYCRRMSVSADKTMSKPPSILVYTNEQANVYNRIRESLARFLPSDRYTVFNITAAAITKQPWVEKTTVAMLFATTSGLDDAAWAKIQTYFNQAGKLIFVCQNAMLTSLSSCDSTKKHSEVLRMAIGHDHAFNKDFESFLKKTLKSLSKHGTVNETFRSKDLTGGASFSVVLSKSKDTPLILYMENSAHQAAAMFSDATPDQLFSPGSKILRDALTRVGVEVQEHEVPNITTGILVTHEEKLIGSVQGIRYGENIGKSPELFLRKEQTVAEQGLPSPSRELLPIQVGHRNLSSYPHFNFQNYFSRLSTNRLGKICLHVPVVTTTMDVMSSLSDGIPSLEGAVVIAGQQIAGKGRGGNEFVSPLGAAMFTFSFDVPRSSTIAKDIGFTQHILAVAIVDAVCSLSGIPDFPLRIKWPNDLYYNRSHKIGGLLVKAKSGDYKISFELGVGLNVTNSNPTICLNDIIPKDQDVEFTVEDVIAETLNKFEVWLNRYELKGKTEFLNKYYEYWLHDREEVLLENSGEKVVIRGLDEHGFLQVRSKRSPGKLISVWDDGNTFDMMKGLIRQKF